MKNYIQTDSGRVVAIEKPGEMQEKKKLNVSSTNNRIKSILKDLELQSKKHIDEINDVNQYY
jgi:hypothetical protein